MKATGIVRRIDELGRVVIPKEIRKTLRIHEGENVEIFVDTSENIILKKFSVMKKLEDFAQNLTDVVNSYIKHNIIITDTDSIIAASGEYKKKYLKQPISNNLLTSIQRRENIVENHFKNIEIINDESIEGSYIINSISAHGDVVGLVIILSTENQVGQLEEKIANITSSFLSKYLEV